MTAAFLAFSHAALVAAYHSGLGGAMRTTNARRAVSPVSDLSILGARDAVNGCVLLPHTPFEGACPPLIFGEMNLQVTCGMPLLLAPPHSLNRSALLSPLAASPPLHQELEDDQECRTQIFLHPDGTVSHGATEGPPPVDACGLWQCGAKQFQMTLTRSFLIPGKTPPRGEHSGKTNLEECSYSVTRIYLGEVNPNADGVNVVDGRMELYDELRYTPAQDPTAIFNFHGCAAAAAPARRGRPAAPRPPRALPASLTRPALALALCVQHEQQRPLAVLWRGADLLPAGRAHRLVLARQGGRGGRGAGGGAGDADDARPGAGRHDWRHDAAGADAGRPHGGPDPAGTRAGRDI